MEQQLAFSIGQQSIPSPQRGTFEHYQSSGALAGLSAWAFLSSQQATNPDHGLTPDQPPEVEPYNAASSLQGRVTGTVRLIQSVARAWSLRNDELASLLAYPSPRFVEELFGGRLTFGDDEDRADRARLIYFIHETLSDLFVDPRDEQKWMRSPLRALGNVAPLDYMVKKRIPGMVEVQQFVEQRLANR